MHFTCNWIDLGWVQYFNKHVVQAKYLIHEDWTKKQVKKSCSLKLDRYLDKNSIYRDLMKKAQQKLDRSLIEAESVEIYEIRISKFDFRLMLTCMCRVSFLTTLDIYKPYFKGRHTWRTHAKSDLVPYSLCKKLLCLLLLRVL